ncbi:MAG: hypothetical protein ACREOZ_01645 [Gloeomargaritales cyanobacterium]
MNATDLLPGAMSSAEASAHFEYFAVHCHAIVKNLSRGMLVTYQGCDHGVIALTGM